MLSASRKDMIGATMYLYCEEKMIRTSDMFFEITNCSPCPICLRMVKNAGIERIITKGGEIFL